MLGNTDSKTLLKSAYSLTARGKVVFEWNHNVFSSPRLCGSFNSSTPSSVLKAQTEVSSGAASNSSLRGSSTFISGGAYYSNSYSITDLPSTYSPNVTANKGFTFPASQNDCFRVSFYTKTTSADNDNIFLHISEYNNSTLQELGTFSRSFQIDNIDWSYNEFIFKVVSINTNKVRIDFSSEVVSTCYISDITVSSILNDEWTKESVLQVKNTFKGFRPGDEVAEKVSGDNYFSQKASKIIYQTGGNYSGKGSEKIYLPNIDTMNYYATNASVAGVHCIYDKTISTNKIVLKLLNGAQSETNFDNIVGKNYTLFTFNKTTNVWTSYAGTNLGFFNENGTMSLYWNGTGWDTTKRDCTISIDGQSISGITNIDGIALKVNSVTSTKGDTTIRFLEVSPRLTLDLSDYLINFSESKELDNGSLPIPVGIATANNASIRLENLPRSYSGGYFSIFSDASSISPLADILKRDVRVKIFYSLINGDDIEVQSDIPFFSGYVDSWTANDVDASVEMFDYAKILQDKKARDILLLSANKSDNSLYTIIEELFQQNGFSDYSLTSSLNDYHLNAFYTDTQKTIWETLQELLLPYQHLAYFDNTGTLRVESFKTLKKDSVDFVITDTDVSGYISNINSLTISKAEKPSEISVRYNTVSTKFNATIKQNDLAKDSVALQEATEIVWEPSEEAGLGFAKLLKTLQPYDKIISLDKSNWKDGIHNWTDYSGHLVIGNEIMKYDGLEVSYTETSGAATNVTVKSPEEYRKIQNDVFNAKQLSGDQTLSISRTGRLMNVQRGLYGTGSGTHYVAGAESLADAPAGVTSGMSLYSKSKRNSSATTLTLSKYVKTDYHGINKDKVLRLESDNSGYTMLAHNADSNSYDTYEFTFAYPKDKTSFHTTSTNPHNENDYMGVFLGFDYSTGKGLFIEFPLKGNTINKKTSVFFNKNSTPTAQSSYLMSILTKKNKKKTITVTDPKSKKKKGKHKKTTKKKTVIETTESFNDHYITITVKLNGKKVRYVKVNGTNIQFRTSNGKAWNGDIASVDRASKNFGIYVGEKTHIQVFSINAYDSINAPIMPSSDDSASNSDISSIFGEGGFGSSVSTVNFKSDSFVHGMKIYDIDFKSGPAFNQKVLKPIGGYEIVDSKGETVTLFQITEGSSDLSTAAFSPYKAKFILLNKSKSIIPTSGSSMSSLKVVGNIIVKSDELVYKKKISDGHKNSSNIEITSDWIQTEVNAKRLAAQVDRFIRMGLDTYNVEIFGNPLLEIGDTVNLYYTQSGITSSSKYIIISVQNEFDGGFNTSLSLRKIER